MAVVVQQTLPFSTSLLQTRNTHRWHVLISLHRPSIKQIVLGTGIRVLVDRSRLQSSSVAIVAAPKPGESSNHLLKNHAVSAIILGLGQEQIDALHDLRTSLVQCGLPKESRVMVIQASNQQTISPFEQSPTLIQCNGVLEFDHLLSILARTSDNTRPTYDGMYRLVRTYHDNVHILSSVFTTAKVSGKVTVSHGDTLCELTSSSDALSRDLAMLLDAQPSSPNPATWSVHFADRNGLSRLEIYIMAGDIGEFFESRKLPFQLSHSSIIDDDNLDRGYAISLCSMPADILMPQMKAVPHVSSTTKHQPQPKRPISGVDTAFNDGDVRKRITSGCEAVIKAEPTITEYDTIVGDGDCGYTLRDGAKQVLQFIKDKDLSRLPDVVDDLVRDLEINMGGTSGALYCIFLTALASSLATEALVSAALQAALDELLKYTRARLGDRTMMDALIPFIKTYNETRDATKGIAEARRGVEGTKKMEAKLGRSTYLDESATHGVPDPGAYGLLVLLEGMTCVDG